MTNRPDTGWVIVPRVATDEQVDAYAHAGDSVFFRSSEAKRQYDAMLSSAPSPLDDAELVDVVAKAIALANEDGLHWRGYIDCARAAIAAIITPKEG